MCYLLHGPGAQLVLIPTNLSGVNTLEATLPLLSLHVPSGRLLNGGTSTVKLQVRLRWVLLRALQRTMLPLTVRMRVLMTFLMLCLWNSDFAYSLSATLKLCLMNATLLMLKLFRVVLPARQTRCVWLWMLVLCSLRLMPK